MSNFISWLFKSLAEEEVVDSYFIKSDLVDVEIDAQEEVDSTVNERHAIHIAEAEEK